MKKTRLITPILLLFILFGCKKETVTITGSGEFITEERALDAFEKIDIRLIFGNNVNIKYGNTSTISITGDDNIVPLVASRIENGKLKVEIEEGKTDEFTRISPIEIEIVTNSLSVLTLSERGSTLISDFQNLNIIEIEKTGINDMNFSNCFATTLKLKNNELGSFNAFEFEVDTLEIEQRGLGNVEIYCNEYLYGVLDDIGNIYYKGKPVIDVDNTGLGEVIDAN